MSDPKDRSTQTQAPPEPPPVRVLAFSVLSVMAEAAAAHLGTALPGDSPAVRGAQKPDDLKEARLAIDAANALLGAVGAALSNDERLAIEGLMTQLQVEYVKRSGS